MLEIQTFIDKEAKNSTDMIDNYFYNSYISWMLWEIKFDSWLAPWDRLYIGSSKNILTKNTSSNQFFNAKDRKDVGYEIFLDEININWQIFRYLSLKTIVWESIIETKITKK